MKPKKSSLSAETQAQILARLRRDTEIRQQGYRERALALFPHVCASCGREFSGKRLKELTVHHKDHNHENNPPDGSNWELLCIYCHDHEHEKYKLKGYVDGAAPDEKPKGPSIANPFANLDNLLNSESSDQTPEKKP
jgi:5-methylcytosine-specific restriction endonuclease McrA